MGLSRRQFLLVGGGGAALLWAGGTALMRTVTGGTRTVIGTGAATAGPVEGAFSGHALRGLPFTENFANAALPAWNVRRPVAILGTTPYGFVHPANRALDHPEILQGRGTVIGLDGRLAGSTGPGLLETVDRFAFEPGSTYKLVFVVAGSQQSSDRIPPSTITASLPGLGVAKSVTLRPRDGFMEFTLDVPVGAPASSSIVLASQNAPGQAGLLLESVSLTRNG